MITFKSKAPKAEGIISSRHCNNPPLAEVGLGSDRKLDRIGIIAGVGIANNVTGVDNAKADQVDERDEYNGMKNGRLKKCYKIPSANILYIDTVDLGLTQ